jgi:hypothetical protein
MAATADQIASVRRMAAEPTTTTYSNDQIGAFIALYPMIDADGLAPGETGYTETYNLNLAAADIWDEKASAAAGKYDFSANGSSFKLSQIMDQYKDMAKTYRSKPVRGTWRLVPNE